MLLALLKLTKNHTFNNIFSLELITPYIFRSPFHAILGLLRPSSSKEISPAFERTPNLAVASLKLIHHLCSNIATSEVTLRFLRSSEDFLCTQASLLPYSTPGKVHIFWEGHKILRNLHLTFDCSTHNQKLKFESSAFAFVCFEISTLLKLEIKRKSRWFKI